MQNFEGSFEHGHYCRTCALTSGGARSGAREQGKWSSRTEGSTAEYCALVLFEWLQSRSLASRASPLGVDVCKL